jgi:hypothetical protein
MAGFWAESAGNPPPGVAPVRKSTPGASYYEDLAARGLLDDAYREAYAFGPNATATHATPASVSGVDESETRKFQDANIARLQSIAAGGPGGMAAPAAYANLAAAQKANSAYAASRATPGNAAMAMRTAGNTNQAMAAGSEAKIAALKAQEQLAAYNALNPALAGMRAQDFGIASERAKLQAQASLANAGFDQGASLANQDAWNRAQAVRRGALGQGMNYDAGSFANSIARRRALAGDANWRNEYDFMKQQRADARTAAYMDTAARGVGYLANASDDDEKDNYKKLGGG